MSKSVFLMRAWASMTEIVPAVLVAAGLAVLWLFVVLLLARNLKMDSGRFKCIAVFYGLSFKDCLAVAASFCRCVFAAYFLLSYTDLALIHYAAIVVFGIMYLIFGGALRRKLAGVLWILAELLIMFSAGMVKNYINLFGETALFVGVYWAISAFLTIFALFVFLNELNDVGQNRKTLDL